MDANAIKAALGGLIALGAVGLVVWMFVDFGSGYMDATAPAPTSKVPEPTREDCLRHIYDRKEDTKRQIREVEERIRLLEDGDTAVKNEAHYDYLEKNYQNQIERLEKVYDGLQRETCDEYEKD